MRARRPSPRPRATSRACGRQHRHQPLAEALLLLDVPDAVALLELRPLRRRLDRLVEAAELVHEAEALRVLAAPDPAAGDLVHLLAASSSGPAPRARGSPRSRRRWPAGTTSATAGSSGRSGRSASLKRVVPTPSVWTPRYFASGLSIGGEEAEDADRAGDRLRGGPDLVGGGRDPVAARGGHAAHRDHERLAGLAHELALAADDLGGEGAAAAAVHAQHDRLHRVVLAGPAQEARGRVAADRPRRLVAVEDVALGHDHRHRARPCRSRPSRSPPFACR